MKVAEDLDYEVEKGMVKLLSKDAFHTVQKVNQWKCNPYPIPSGGHRPGVSKKGRE